jgi:hypothetical protein
MFLKIVEMIVIENVVWRQLRKFIHNKLKVH